MKKLFLLLLLLPLFMSCDDKTYNWTVTESDTYQYFIDDSEETTSRTFILELTDDEAIDYIKKPVLNDIDGILESDIIDKKGDNKFREVTFRGYKDNEAVFLFKRRKMNRR